MSVTIYCSTQSKIIPQDEFSKLYAKYEGGENGDPHGYSVAVDY
jgi:hypothetical protein